MIFHRGRKLAGRASWVIVLFWAALGNAQIDTATILGTARDRNGEPLPGATVAATQVETGATRTEITGNRGEYRFPALSLGTYQIQASLTGFQTEVRSGVPLNVGAEVVVEFTLAMGSVTEQVTRAAEAPPIETTSATLSGLVNPQQLRDIPLNTRSFLELVPLQAGAVLAAAGEQSAARGFAEKLSISGARYNSNSFLLDGADMNDATGSSGSAAGTVAGVETLREIQVITNAYDAEYGRHSGGVVSAVTQSGTKEFHGALFEFLRNDNLDAARWEDKAVNGGQKPEFRRNQFGGSAGGPLRPDKLFFFGSFEGLRELLGGTAEYIVPGPEMRAGNYITTGIANGQIVRSATTSLGVKPAVKAFLEAYPEANAPCRVDCFPANPFWSADGTGLYVKQNDQTTGQNFWTARLDQQFNESNALFGRITVDRASRTKPGFDTAAISATRSWYATAEQSHIYAPALLGRTHFSFVRTNLGLYDRRLDQMGQAAYGLPVFNFTGSDVPGILTIGGLAAWGGSASNPTMHIQNTFQIKEDLFGSAGRHGFKLGVELERFQVNQRSDQYSSGAYTFSSFDRFLQNQADVADFVRPGADNIRGWRQNLVGLYWQDDISLRAGLTLNLGLRYEAITVPKEVNGKVANIRNLAPDYFDSVQPAQTDVGDPYFRNPSLRNFAPRVGMAWTPFSSRWLAVRAGVGLYHDQLLPTYYLGSGVRMEPFYGVVELLAANLAKAGLPIRFPNDYAGLGNLLSLICCKPQAEGFQFQAAQPAVLKASLNVQQQLAQDSTMELGYSFSRGRHLVRGGIMLNTTPVETLGGKQYILVTQPLPNPYWNRMRWRLTDGSSWYHALLASFQKRFRQGFQAQLSYTFSKSVDDSSSWNGSTDYGVADARGIGESKWRGPSAFDVRHSLSSNFVYQLPGGNLTGAKARWLGGWSLSGLVRLASGFPLTPGATRPRSITAGGVYTVQYVGGSSLDLIPGGNNNPVHPQNPDQYFDRSQFAYPAHGVNQANLAGSAKVFDPAVVNLAGLGPAIAVGNLGRNTLTTPGSAIVDLALLKRTPFGKLGEAGAVELRIEGFNILNRPNFAAPATNLFNTQGLPVPGAGAISSTRTSSRQLQLALRLVF